MVKNNMEQVKPVFDLQFFAEPEMTTANPPVTEGQNATTAIPVQANTPTDGTATNNQPVDWNTHQAAIRGMNDAQREAASWKKVGFSSPEEALKAFELTKAINENPQLALTEMINKVGPQQAFNELAKQIGPFAAAQAYNQVFSGQTQQTDPYAELSSINDPVEFARKSNEIQKQQMKTELMKEFEQKFGQVINPIQQYTQQQQIEAAKNQVRQQFNNFNTQFPGSGIDSEGLIEFMVQKNIPITQTMNAIAEKMGGWDKYNEFVMTAGSKRTTAKAVQNSETTATVTPGGVTAVNNNPLYGKERLEAAYRWPDKQT